MDIKKMIMICAIFMILTSCRAGDKQLTDADIHVGTDGLEIELVSLLPEMFEGASFEVIANIFNKGAYDINNGYLTLGIEQDYMCIADEYGDECMQKQEPMLPITLLGKSIINPTGSFDIKRYYVKAKELEKQSLRHKAAVLVTACYDYATDLTTQVCIDTHAYEINPLPKACEAEEQSFNSQGAPIAITKIETNILPAGSDAIKPMFIIYIENKGNGKAIRKDSLQQVCSAAGLKYKDWNTVYLAKIEFMNGEYKYEYGREDNNMECMPQPLRLKGEEDYIRCTLKDNAVILKTEPTFMSQMYVKLEYGYTTTVSEDTEIQRIQTY